MKSSILNTNYKSVSSKIEIYLQKPSITSHTDLVLKIYDQVV